MSLYDGRSLEIMRVEKLLWEIEEDKLVLQVTFFPLSMLPVDRCNSTFVMEKVRFHMTWVWDFT